MDYAQTLNYLDRFINYEQRPTDDYSEATYKLDRVDNLLERLGNPHLAYPSVLIAGSKGKGSTAAMLAAMCQAAGLRTGFYSKPHLHTFRERVRVDGELISEEEMAALFTYVLEPVVSEIEAEGDISMVPTYFELSAILGFLYFARMGVDIAVVEVGMGGRLDATNVVDPLVSVIAPISLEHMAVLGDTLAKIAYEKAGIIRPNGIALIAQQPAEAEQVFVDVCNERNARLVRAPQMAPLLPDSVQHLKAADDLPAGWQFTLGAPEGELDVRLPLLGRHQLSNAQTAVCAMLLLWEQRPAQSEPVPGEMPLLPINQRVPATLAALEASELYAAMQAGLAAVVWQGRLEIVNRSPLVVVDGAHNGDSAERLAEALVEDFGLGARQAVFVFGVNSDKDVAGIIGALSPLAAAVVVTPLHSARSLDPEIIAPLWAANGVRTAIAAGASASLQAAAQLASETQAQMICATGSLYLVGEVRDVFGLSLGSDVR